MTLTRRNFLQGSLAAGTLTNMTALAGVADTTGQLEASPAPQTALAEHDSYTFWSHFLDPVDPTVRRTRGGVRLAAAERRVEFLHSGSKGLRYVDDIEEDELLDHAGDVEVSMSLGQFRPGSGDWASLKEVNTSQLRVDCIQTKPLVDFLAPLAWSALAMIKTSGAGKFPSLQQLGFHAPEAMNGVNRILLPGGRGKLAVNVCVTKGDSLLHKVVKDAFLMAPVASMIMNLPAISVVALRTFSEFYSKMEERAMFLMNSALTDAVATKQASADPERAVKYLHLVSGDFLLVPNAHLEELKPRLTNLELRQGYLVEKDASPSDPVEARAERAVPGVTYATLRMTVGPAAYAIGCKGDNASPSSGETHHAEKPTKKEP